MALYERTASDVVGAADLFYSPSATDGRNLSFETAGTILGTAYGWSVGSFFKGLIPAIFSADAVPPTDWDPWETNERQWRLPYVVHTVADPGNAVAAPAASNLATAITLVNELRADLNGHLLVKGNTHRQASPHSQIEIIDASDLATLLTMVNLVKSTYNAHLAAWHTAHRRYDTPNVVSVADATDEATAITLANAIRTAYSAHRIQITFGSLNEDALFALTSSDIAAGVFHDDIASDGFEFGWALGDFLTTLVEQRYQVSTDASALWPIGHVELLDKLENIATEAGRANVPEDFTTGWLLPGAISSWPNNFLAERYKSTGTWIFPDNRLQQGICDTFEAGWGADTFVTEYWDGGTSTWRFTDLPAPNRQLVCRGFGYRTAATYDLATGTFTALSTFSPTAASLWLTVTTETGALSSGWLQIDFLEADGSAHSLQLYLLSPTTPPRLIWAVGHEENRFRSNPSTAEADYAFEAVWNGLKQVTAMSAVDAPNIGAVAIRGGKNLVESFEEEWDLTLTI